MIVPTTMQKMYLSLFDKFAQKSIKKGIILLILPDKRQIIYGGTESNSRRVTIRILSYDFFRLVVMRHDTGLGEAYMDHLYETDDLSGLMAIIVENASYVEDNRGMMSTINFVGDKLLWLAHKFRPNNKAGSRKNIEEHYDAGNEMYKLFLDDSMMYSAAIHTNNPDETLYEAQMNKLDAIISQAGINASDHVLEIGCGWGAFAIRAAQRTGCRVTCLTISKEQLKEAEERVKKNQLSDKIKILFCDYRDCPGEGTYDKVVSIEMIEAVGHEHLIPYFSIISKMLKKGGRAVIQAICTPDERYAAYCNCSDFIREHIFPGGHLPCIEAILNACKGTGLVLTSKNDIGLHYAITLREWRKQWELKKDQVLALGYSEKFWRKYHFYFAYCEAGFEFKYVYNYQITFDKVKEPEKYPKIVTIHKFIWIIICLIIFTIILSIFVIKNLLQ